MSDKRSFAIASAEVKLPEDYQGRFESKQPRSAGIKAARRLFALSKTKKTEIRFVLKEITMGSEKKEFHYIAIKRKLAEPKTITRGDSTITVEYEYTVKACK